MNQGPAIFLGVFAALSVSWYGMIVQPQLQLGRATPGTNVLNKAASNLNTAKWIEPQVLHPVPTLKVSMVVRVRETTIFMV